MPRLPDRFDLWVRRARETADPARQVDLVLGALIALPDLYFLNNGTKEQPRIGRAKSRQAQDSEDEFAAVFTDGQRLKDFAEERGMLGGTRFENDPPAIVSPAPAGLHWCIENRLGLLINPNQGEIVQVPPATLASFFEEWNQRGARQAAGFWIPNMTTEEQDFWQEHGL
jgi:hypothetical protein